MRTIFVLACLFIASQLNAQESYPAHILGFFKAGQHVGWSERKEAGVELRIIDSDSTWAILRDAKKLSLDELRKRYPAVEEFVAKATQSTLERQKKKNPADDSTPVFKPGGLADCYGKVLNVGDDYLLLELDDGSRVLFASSEIGKLTWHRGLFALMNSGPSND